MKKKKYTYIIINNLKIIYLLISNNIINQYIGNKIYIFQNNKKYYMFNK